MARKKLEWSEMTDYHKPEYFSGVLNWQGKRVRVTSGWTKDNVIYMGPYITIDKKPHGMNMSDILDYYWHAIKRERSLVLSGRISALGETIDWESIIGKRKDIEPMHFLHWLYITFENTNYNPDNMFEWQDDIANTLKIPGLLTDRLMFEYCYVTNWLSVRDGKANIEWWEQRREQEALVIPWR